MLNSILKSSVSLLVLIPTGATHAKEMNSVEIMDEIVVVGVAGDRKGIAGSATRIDSKDIEAFKFQDISRMLRLAPGVNIQEEDGYGLRPNIGLRGTGVERSSKITLMEDGVLIAPAPYAAPSAYYFPTAARMEALEIRKGSAAIKFGPRTVGGAVNMTSRSIPDEFGGFVDAKYGSDNHVTLHGVAGGSTENFGVVGEVFHSSADGFKELPGGENTGFNIQDYLFKARVNTDEDADVYQSLTLKVGATTHESDETYLGLTQADFNANPYQRYAASALDNMKTDHEQFQLSHSIKVDKFSMITVAYNNTFKRDWFKLDYFSDSGVKLKPGNILDNPAGFTPSTDGLFVIEHSDALAILRGDADSDTGAIRIKHNNRAYRSRGIQNIMQYEMSFAGMDHKFEFSSRYHEDYEDRMQNRENFTMVDGTLVYDSEDAVGSAGNRVASADAWAFYLSDEISWGKWTLLPGVRYESIDFKREDYTSPDRSTLKGAAKEHTIDVVTPGFGATYQYSDELLLMAGVFKGFNPSGPGATNAKEETSLSLEAGFIYDLDSLHLEVTGFYSDYNNILGSCTASSGSGDCEIGDQFNGGAADIYGLELTASHNFMLSDRLNVPFKANYTYTSATFETSFEDGFWGDVMSGDTMPYTAEHQLNIISGLEGEKWSVNFLMNYQSAVRTEAGSGTIAANEKIAGRAIIDINASYYLRENVTLYGGVQNVFDKKYAVARRPYGLRPGKPATVSAGLKLSF